MKLEITKENEDGSAEGTIELTTEELNLLINKGLLALLDEASRKELSSKKKAALFKDKSAATTT